MSFAYALKVLTDLLFYFTLVSMFGPSAGQSGMLMSTPVICAACAYFSFALRGCKRKWLRFVPLIALAAVFAFTRTTADIVISVPPALYVCWYVWKRPVLEDYRDTLSRFFLCLKIFPCVFIFAALVGNWTAMRDIVVPYLFMFLVLTVILLRTLRHDAATMAQTRFKLMNVSSIAAVGAVGWLLSSGLMMRFFRFIGACIVRFILRPVMMLVVYAFAGIVWLLSQPFRNFSLDQEFMDLTQIQENMELGDITSLFSGDEAAQETSPILDYVMIGLAVIAAIVLVFLIFRFLVGRGKREEDNQFDDVRASLAEEAPRERVNPRENRQRVRHYYRKFLKLCTQRGFELTEFQDSSEIERGTRYIFRNPAQTKLRDVYVRARYSSGEITPEDVQAAKESYGKLKKNEL